MCRLVANNATVIIQYVYTSVKYLKLLLLPGSAMPAVPKAAVDAEGTP